MKSLIEAQFIYNPLTRIFHKPKSNEIPNKKNLSTQIVSEIFRTKNIRTQTDFAAIHASTQMHLINSLYCFAGRIRSKIR